MAKWGKCDYTQFKRLQNKLEKSQNKNHDKFYEDCTKELAGILLSKVIKLTPIGKKPKFENTKVKVKGASGKTKEFLTRDGETLEDYWKGYEGGTLRRGWTAKTHKAAENGADVDEKDYIKTLPIAKIGDSFKVEIVNSVNYASYVEYGHVQRVGRYVPALGRKLTTSFVEGKHMLSKAEEELEARKDEILKKKLDKYMKENFSDK